MADQLTIYDTQISEQPCDFIAVCSCGLRYLAARSAPGADWPKNVHLLSAIYVDECKRRGHQPPAAGERGAVEIMRELAPWVVG